MASIKIEFNDNNNLLFVIKSTQIIQTIHTDPDHGDYQSHCNDVKILLDSSNKQDIDHVNSLITNVIRAKNLSIFKYFLSHGYKIDVLNEKNQTAIHLIFYNDWYETENQEIIDLLSDCKPAINYTDSNGLNLLHIACAIGSLDLATYYLDRQEDVNARYITDVKGNKLNRSGFTPLHFAELNSRVEIVDLLRRRGADVKATDCHGKDPLYYHKYEEPGKSGKADEESTQEEDAEISNRNGDTMIHNIIRGLESLRLPSGFSKISFDDSEKLQTLERLLTSDKTIDINAKNNQGETPLQLAVSYMSTDIVNLLLEHNADLSSLKLDHTNSYFFRYHDIVPNLEVVVHVLDIIESLERKGFKFTGADNLAVLKFLLHKHDNCECLDGSRDNDDIIFKIINLMKCGSAGHIKFILKKIEDELKNESTSVTRYDRRLLYIAFYKKYIKSADFYIDKEVEEAIIRLLLANNMNQDGPISNNLQSKVDKMKSIILKDNLNVYDVTTKHPHKIYQYVFGNEFDYKFYNLDNFPGYATFISGHFARSLVRNYAEKVADAYLKVLLPLLPSSFYKSIIDYLGNEDILNVAVAVVSKTKDA